MPEEIDIQYVKITQKARRLLYKIRARNPKLYKRIVAKFCKQYLYVSTNAELHKYANIIKDSHSPRRYKFTNIKGVLIEAIIDFQHKHILIYKITII